MGSYDQTVQPVHEPLFPGVISSRKRYPSDNNSGLSGCLTSSDKKKKNQKDNFPPSLMEGEKGLLDYRRLTLGRVA